MAYAHVQCAAQNGMAPCEGSDDSEIEPTPVTPPSCDRPECSRILILDTLKPPTRSNLARKTENYWG